MKVQVIVKTVYGRELIYPHNTEALNFAELLQSKTFSLKDLSVMKRMGIEIEQVDGFSILNIETILSQKVS